MTQEEARMACVEQLRIAHSVEESVMVVDERVQSVGDDVQNVGKNVEDVRTEVQGVDRKLDDTNRSSSVIAHALLPNAQAYSQGTCSATIFYVGSRLRIHP
jgi:archaellum component FlaC